MSTAAHPPPQVIEPLPMEPLELDGSPINPSPSTPATHLVNGTVVPVRRSSGDEHPNGEIVTEARARDPAVLANIPKSPAAQDYEVAAGEAALAADGKDGFTPVLPKSASTDALSKVAVEADKP
ncbi:MAG: hypothetical protein M1824_002979 [Vezdaea acicularis]|nr:MAG: hypothetical protein M1824_002979 [Vezdaea acicularis]